MSIRIMTQVWEIDLPDSEKIVLLALADCANDEGAAWPSVASLQRKCSKGARTIQGVIKRLVAAGHLSRREVPGRGCSYVVHPRKDCAPAEPAPPQRSRPRKDCAPPPQRLRDTPAAAADNPSKNLQEPSKGEVETSPPSPVSDEGSAGEPVPANDEVTAGDVVEVWNDMAGRTGLPRVARLTDERRRKLARRIREHSIDDWTEAIRAIERSPFLRGENQRGWRVNFDFLLQPSSFAKLIEGTYDQSPAPAARQRR